MFMHASISVTDFSRGLLLQKPKIQCLLRQLDTILMNYMNLIGYTLQLLFLTLLQVALSRQQGLLRFVNITQHFNKSHLVPKTCCGNKKEVSCNTECEISLSVCLIEFNDKLKTCLISAKIRNFLATSSLTVKLNQTFGVSIFPTYLIHYKEFVSY